MDNRAEVREFLMSRRAKLTPDAAGIIAGSNRRVPGRRTPRGPGGLTIREIEVLRLIVAGCSNRGIADRLVISEGTAGRHVSNVYLKLGAHSRLEAARIASERGLLGDDPGDEPAP